MAEKVEAFVILLLIVWWHVEMIGEVYAIRGTMEKILKNLENRDKLERDRR